MIPPRLALLSFVLAIGWASILFRLAGAPPLLAAGARVGIATALLLPFFGRQAAACARGHARATLAGAGAGLLLAAHFAAWVPSLALTTVAASTVLCSTQPLFAAALEYLLLGERPAPRVLLGIALGMVGTAIVCFADFGIPDAALSARAVEGDLFALAGGFFAACYYLVGRAVRRSIPLGGYLVWVNGTAACALLLGSLAIGEPWFHGGYAKNPSWEGIGAPTLLYFALLALVPHLLGHGAANYAVRHMPATIVNVAVLGEPVLATILAVPLFGEWPTNPPMFAGGAAVLLTGLVLALTSPAPRPPGPGTPPS
jgi:drug/metabolite transporter (DMT)-like permease